MPRHLLYARKSSESEDRQVLSIDSQISELQTVARSRDIDVAGVFQEARSAKSPGRPVFEQLMAALTRHEATGVLCWKLDRLARNPIDGGAIIWALDQGQLEEIATPGRTYRNAADDKLWMQLEFGMAKKYVDDLSDNVRRGNRAKLEQGWLPGPAPLGYLNDLATKTIVPDPDRFHLVRQMWERVLAGERPSAVLRWANTDLSLRTPKRRRQGGRPVALSSFYRMLADPFYCGVIQRRGERFLGAHELMVTHEEFEAVQEALGRPRRRPRRPDHVFPFTGLIRCGSCGLSVTAETKQNRHGTRYTYYHCTKRRGRDVCREPSIRAEALHAQALDFLRTIALHPKDADYVMKTLLGQRTSGEAARAAHRRSIESAEVDARKQIDRLTDLRLRDLVSDDEYRTKRDELVAAAARARERIRRSDLGDEWFEPSARGVSLLTSAVSAFEHGDPQIQREIFVAVGSNPVLSQKTLRMEAKKPLSLMAKGPHVPGWLAVVDTIRTLFTENPQLIQWPKYIQEQSLDVSIRQLRRRKRAARKKRPRSMSPSG